MVVPMEQWASQPFQDKSADLWVVLLSDHNEKYSDRMERSCKTFAVTFELRFPFPLRQMNHPVIEIVWWCVGCLPWLRLCGGRRNSCRLIWLPEKWTSLWLRSCDKNIERHTAHTIVSWPNPITMGNRSYFRFDDDNKTTYIYSFNHPNGNG